MAITERTFCCFDGPVGCKPRIVLGLGNNQRLAMLRHPAGHAFAHLHAQTVERRLFPARGNRVVELLLGLVQHQQRPQLRLDDPLHVFEDGAQNGVQVEARGERARQLVEDKQICERDAAFRLVRHRGPMW